MRGNRETPHSDYLELVYLEPDGELTSAEEKSLEWHAARCDECRALRHELVALDSLLAQARVEPDPDLAQRVVRDLPPAPWEMRRPATWRGAAAAILGLLTASYALTFQGQPAAEALPWLGTLAALAELFRSAALAGAGLLSASWAGVGLALAEVLSRSPMGFVVFGLFVLGVDALFLRYLWRSARAEAETGGSIGRRANRG